MLRPAPRLPSEESGRPVRRAQTRHVHGPSGTSPASPSRGSCSAFHLNFTCHSGCYERGTAFLEQSDRPLCGTATGTVVHPREAGTEAAIETTCVVFLLDHLLLLDVVRVALKPLEVELRVVVEALARHVIEPGVERIALELAALALFVFGQNPLLCGCEDAIEAAQDGHGQHDALVLGWPVRAAEQVGDLPDEVREVVVVRHCQGTF